MDKKSLDDERCCSTCQWYCDSPNSEYGFCDADIGDLVRPNDYCGLYINDYQDMEDRK